MPTISIKGLDKIIGKFEDLSNNIQSDIQLALNSYILDVENDAKRLVSDKSSDEGLLLRSINTEFGDGTVAIKATAKYAAYIEFGTRKWASQYVASLPEDWQQYASQFKGPMSGGGKFDDFLRSIMAWCKRKGIDEAAAYPIAKKIMINGIRPRPFLYPSIRKNLPQLIEDLKDIVK